MSRTPKSTNESAIRSAIGSERVRAVGHYYDRTSRLWRDAMGDTIQAGILAPVPGQDAVRASNRFFARRCGAGPGTMVLDAGCGFCGPAIELARQYDGLEVDALNISPAQVDIARQNVAEAGLEARIRVHLGDYHDLPFADGHFDVVQFLESSAHSDDPARLVAEAWRVLRAGGRLYLKDGFLADPATDPAPFDPTRMDEAYLMQTRTVSETLSLIESTGFEVLDHRDLTRRVNAAHFVNAMQRLDESGQPQLTPLGRAHYRAGESIHVLNWPVIAEIRARKP